MTSFLVGDKVRLTGDLWDDDDFYPYTVGSIVTIIGHDDEGRAVFNACDSENSRSDGTLYIDDDDYSAELVQPARSGYQETPDGRLTKNGISQREAHIRTIEDLQRVIRSRNETIDSLQAKVTEQADAFPFKPLADLQRRIGRANAEKGFHEEGEWIRSLAAEQEIDEVLLRNYAVARLALITTEVAEAIEEIRHGRAADETWYDESKYPFVNIDPDHPTFPRPIRKPEGVPSELADIVIRAFDFADEFSIDLPAMIDEKLRFNATRPFKHAKEM